MPEYVSSVLLEVNGKSITDFKSVAEGEVEYRKQVNLPGKTGFTRSTPRYPLSVEYVVPADSPEFDFSEVEEGTLTIDKKNGKRVTFTGVSTLTVGETKYGEDEEATRTISFMATGRNES